MRITAINTFDFRYERVMVRNALFRRRVDKGTNLARYPGQPQQRVNNIVNARCQLDTVLLLVVRRTIETKIFRFFYIAKSRECS